MSSWDENIEKIVAKIEGSKKGNAFLIDRNRAVTVKHCIQDSSAKVKLVFPKIQKGAPIEVWATVVEQFDPEEDELLLLKLEREFPQIDISIAVMKMYPSDEARVFGYDANYLALGRWTELISVASVIPNPDIVQDMYFDIKNSRENDFSGLSGSPIVKGNYIIGIVSQETLENSRAISIHGISVHSCPHFWEKHRIAVIELSNVGNVSKKETERSMPIVPLKIPLELKDKIKAATNSVAVGAYHVVVLKNDGTVVASGDNRFGQCNVQNWKNIIQIVCGAGYTAGLKADGTVVTVGSVMYGGETLENVRYWKNIVYLSAGYEHLIGLRKNGTSISCGYNGMGQCDVLPWNNLIDVAAGYRFSVGVKKNGSLIYIGENNRTQSMDVSMWRDIVQIEAGNTHVVGLKANGRVVASGKNDFGECDVDEWKDIISVSACMRHTIGLKIDGSLLVAGEEFAGLSEVIQWRDVLFVSMFSQPIGHGDFSTHVIAITSNHKILYAGTNHEG